MVCHSVRKVWRDDETCSVFDPWGSNEQELKGAENREQVFLGKYQWDQRMHPKRGTRKKSELMRLAVMRAMWFSCRIV